MSTRVHWLTSLYYAPTALAALVAAARHQEVIK